MRRFFINIFLWVYIKIHTIFINLGFAMQDAAQVGDIDVNEKDKKVTRKLHHNQLLEKFYVGQREEKYVQDYYELLKKADKFMRNATPHQKAVAADKNAMNVGQKDMFGRSYDHIGFFNEGHKHAGKTMGQVLDLEMKERGTTDDGYELLIIFDNTPVEVGLSKIADVVDAEYKVQDLINKSKTYEFPMKVERDSGHTLNKIEQLTAFVHVKKIGFEHRQLEFFIPKKFNLGNVKENSDIFKEIINIKFIYFDNNYGELIGFRIVDYTKRITTDDFEVLKFHALEMEIIITH